MEYHLAGSNNYHGDILKVSCKPVGHADSEPYPSEEIVQQFFKEVSELREAKEKALVRWTPFSLLLELSLKSTPFLGRAMINVKMTLIYKAVCNLRWT